MGRSIPRGKGRDGLHRSWLPPQRKWGRVRDRGRWISHVESRRFGQPSRLSLSALPKDGQESLQYHRRRNHVGKEGRLGHQPHEHVQRRQRAVSWWWTPGVQAPLREEG